MGWGISPTVEVQDHSVTVPRMKKIPKSHPPNMGYPKPEGAQPTGPQQCHSGVTWPCLLTCCGTGRCW